MLKIDFPNFLQVICFIHFLESPLKHMLEFWDLGPGMNDTFITNGPIAKAIKYLKLKAFVKFEAMRDILIPTGKKHAFKIYNSYVWIFYFLNEKYYYVFCFFHS